MFYKLKHAIFGWDYIYWDNSCDRGIARVYIDGENRAYYWQYKAIKALSIIKRADQVVWLTCQSGKYLYPEGTEGYIIK